MDNSVIKAQLTSLKKRVKAQKAPLADGERADNKESREEAEEAIATATTDNLNKVDNSFDHGLVDDISPSLNNIKLNGGPLLSSSAGAIIKWSCMECSNECIPVMRESRCLCGHRLKEHKAGSGTNPKFVCSSRGCRCKHFFFLVAEGAWILRCRCKHKHIEHDCGPGPHRCDKCSSCSGFDSPWVCNCGHTWASHQQRTVTVTETNVEEILGGQPNKKQHFYRQDGLDG